MNRARWEVKGKVEGESGGKDSLSISDNFHNCKSDTVENTGHPILNGMNGHKTNGLKLETIPPPIPSSSSIHRRESSNEWNSTHEMEAVIDTAAPSIKGMMDWWDFVWK